MKSSLPLIPGHFYSSFSMGYHFLQETFPHPHPQGSFDPSSLSKWTGSWQYSSQTLADLVTNGITCEALTIQYMVVAAIQCSSISSFLFQYAEKKKLDLCVPSGMALVPWFPVKKYLNKKALVSQKQFFLY